MPGDVLLADRLADRALDQADAALPPGPQLRRAVEGAAVEVEVGLDEVVGEVRRRGAQHPGEQPGPPVLDRDLAEHGRQVLEVRRLPHAGLGEQLVGLVRRRAEVGDVDVPVEGGAELAELGDGLEVVGLLDVAGLGALPVAAGQLGVDVEHGASPGFRVLRVDQSEQRGQVADVRLADRSELLVAVVGLVRQPEPALRQVEQVAVGVAVVGVDVGAEQPVAAEPLELAEERRHVADVAQRRDRVDQRLDRPGAEPVDPLGVHERREQVADLLRVGVQLGALVGVGRHLREVLDDRVDLLLGHVGQLHERPPAGPVRGDLGLDQPPAVDVAEQVVLRPDVRVHALAGVVQNAHAAEISRRFSVRSIARDLHPHAGCRSPRRGQSGHRNEWSGPAPALEQRRDLHDGLAAAVEDLAVGSAERLVESSASKVSSDRAGRLGREQRRCRGSSPVELDLDTEVGVRSVPVDGASSQVDRLADGSPPGVTCRRSSVGAVTALQDRTGTRVEIVQQFKQEREVRHSTAGGQRVGDGGRSRLPGLAGMSENRNR